MKTVITFIFIFFLTIGAMAQSTSKEVKVETITNGVELTITIEKSTTETNKVARLYMFKNSRVKKALTFKTKRNKSKMA
ncbi:hypothetical protein [Croceitalea sp. P059]|uniref:hypothetical protein n=1 Tax=Croceitalea sp. P059 TaxID=3075601 RepID=UPI0028857715|nr:hypothetical protein [Croceitalea sp. P059]MDT0540085.1 hypothetical protein [Croceitalea sp. P059]